MATHELCNQVTHSKFTKRIGALQ